MELNLEVRRLRRELSRQGRELDDVEHKLSLANMRIQKISGHLTELGDTMAAIERIIVDHNEQIGSRYGPPITYGRRFRSRSPLRSSGGRPPLNP